MYRDKPDERTKKVIGDICQFAKEYGSCETCRFGHAHYDEPCYYESVAKAIVLNDYHKGSCTATDIIDEVRGVVMRLHKDFKSLSKVETSPFIKPVLKGEVMGMQAVLKMLNDLKKKYEVSNNECR